MLQRWPLFLTPEVSYQDPSEPWDTWSITQGVHRWPVIVVPYRPFWGLSRVERLTERSVEERVLQKLSQNLEVVDPFLIPNKELLLCRALQLLTLAWVRVWTPTCTLHRQLFKKTKHLRTILSSSSALNGKRQLQKYTKPLFRKVF